MTKFPFTTRLSFQTKVLVPVILIMVALTATTMWLVNGRINRQLEDEAGQQLDTADKVFHYAQTNRANELVFRYRNVSNEPRFKAALGTGDSRTISELFKDYLLHEDDDTVGVMLITDRNGKRAASAQRAPDLDIDIFEAHSTVAIEQAFAGHPAVETIQVAAIFLMWFRSRWRARREPR
jgi:hypothetical protein